MLERKKRMLRFQLGPRVRKSVDGETVQRTITRWVQPEDQRKGGYLARVTVETYTREAQTKRFKQAKSLERGLRVNGIWEKAEQVTESMASAIDLGIDVFYDQLPDDLKHLNPRIVANVLGIIRNASTQIRQAVFKESRQEVQTEIQQLRVQKRIIV